jgi:pilus assembly protein Flp/PilA
MANLIAPIVALYTRLSARVQKEAGQALVEYALLLALIAMVCIVMIALVGSEANSIFNNIAVRMGAALNP